MSGGYGFAAENEVGDARERKIGGLVLFEVKVSHQTKRVVCTHSSIRPSTFSTYPEQLIRHEPTRGRPGAGSPPQQDTVFDTNIIINIVITTLSQDTIRRKEHHTSHTDKTACHSILGYSRQCIAIDGTISTMISSYDVSVSTCIDGSNS